MSCHMSNNSIELSISAHPCIPVVQGKVRTLKVILFKVSLYKFQRYTIVQGHRITIC